MAATALTLTREVHRRIHPVIAIAVTAVAEFVLVTVVSAVLQVVEEFVETRRLIQQYPQPRRSWA